MRSIMGSMLCLVGTMGLLLAPIGLAATPDLRGVWELAPNGTRTFDSTAKNLDEQKAPFKPAWAAEWQKTRARVRAGMKVWDPTIVCLPPGMPRTMNMPYPFEILTEPERITLLTEFFNETRRIWMDGRQHPPADELEPTFSGHSIGRWEADTLLIDTVGVRHETVIDASMVPHSDQLHITERVRMAGADTLEWTLTLEDPVVLTGPWTTTKRYVRSPPGTAIREYICAESATTDPYVPSPDDAKYLQPDPRLKTLP